MSSITRQSLLKASESFCTAFASQSPPSEILTKHFTQNSNDIIVFEHGLPRLAPFLGREYKGKDGFLEYFNTIGEQLSYKDMRFSDYIVDAEVRKVSVRGEAVFTNKKTGQSWDEVFRYVLEFDEDARVKTYEIWADSGAAYLASRGELS
ncbi:hypothetical protein NEUTE1DRAFT_82594 [Neurospora tetrasperma FGSC 2508]|uniref:SnoaL-like domain-containing protein n=1 Tax=Neurospora tetrasperma (strain FGSC 2508 / ATCC MYA-4615 / P0657) TaxID=510951 RepID=F8MKF3_NEUT8|nr:uncharacterized protein NEUTE1DRAFT_82594 [Neurospora tetrasperma FGSC 2508]EGO58234.1 hypothetical protein NEUTE1DRAFT_82594 [Neurospora tetrasperma FGSC 2508]EGZ71450.1 hypothetical protein NEUTE2DRAFT_109994 [Neurospora tetrasperma FGSC 2509]